MAKKRLVGKIIGKSGDKTYKIEVEYTKRHPKYKKIITIRRRFLVHATQDYENGEVVVAEETKRISKRKHFKIIGLYKGKSKKNDANKVIVGNND